jgi:hypothetical protein
MWLVGAEERAEKIDLWLVNRRPGAFQPLVSAEIFAGLKLWA